MEKEKGNNCTSSNEFLLLGMRNVPSLHTPLFLLLLLIYLVIVVGNSLAMLVVADRHLHTPMCAPMYAHFFLGNLSFVETCYSSTILPQLLASFLTGDRTISAQGCMTQLYFLIAFAATECFLLAAMSYDQCLAIRQPLLCASLMTWKVCLLMAAASWPGGLVFSIIATIFLSRLKFCGPNATDNFFFDFTPLLELAYSDTSVVKIVTFILTLLDSVLPFLITLAYYVSIITAILRISSSTGRQKAFSICSLRLTVVTVFYGCLIIVHMLPRIPRLRQLNKVFSFSYTVLMPLVDPLIYSKLNKEVREALRKALRNDLGGT